MVVVWALVFVVVVVLLLASSVGVSKQCGRAVKLRLGRVGDGGVPGLGVVLIVPLIDRLRCVSLRMVTMPTESQGIITRDRVAVDVWAVAYVQIDGAAEAVVSIEDAVSAVDQIPQTPIRAVFSRFWLDETLSDADAINRSIREILDDRSEASGVQITLVELKDIGPSRQHEEAREGASGGGRARAREDHRRRGRGARRRQARGGRGRDARPAACAGARERRSVGVGYRTTTSRLEVLVAGASAFSSESRA